MSDMTRDRVIIKPRGRLAAIDFAALWEYRELLYFLTLRDIKVRYKQTAIGIVWAVIQPVMQMIVFTIFFGHLAGLPTEGLPGPVFYFSGTLIWLYFSQSLSSSSNSIVGSANLITKVYFPRLIIPLSASLSGIVDYAVASVILLGLMLYYGIVPGVAMLLVPMTLIGAFIAATGMGLWLSALNVKYRDVRYVVPYFIQLLMFATPVIYPVTFVPEPYRWILALNPISGVIEAHRSCFVGHKPIDWDMLALSLIVGLVIFISGLYFFRSTEKTFSDII